MIKPFSKEQEYILIRNYDSFSHILFERNGNNGPIYVKTIDFSQNITTRWFLLDYTDIVRFIDCCISCQKTPVDYEKNKETIDSIPFVWTC